MLNWVEEKVTQVCALLVGLTVGRWAWNVGFDNVRGEVGFGGIAIFIVAGVLGLIAMAVFIAIAEGTGSAPRWLAACGGAVALFFFGFILPVMRNAEVARQQQAAHQARAENAARQVRAEREKWIQELRDSGAHAPAGTPPPFLEVRDEGRAVEIRNTTGGSLSVALARVKPAPSGAKGWIACGMHTAGRHRGSRYYYYALQPGESARYEPYTDCAAAFEGAPIEFRVGQRPGDTAFWSDSAFEAIDGQEYALGK